MFMRFVNLKINPASVVAFERFYEHRIGPTLRKVPGCVFASLIHSTESESEFLSFTLWESAGYALAYEQSGAYAKLIAENEPFEAESTEWKIQLTDDNTLEYRPVREAPVVQAMPVLAGTPEGEAISDLTDETYIRILHSSVAPGKFGELSTMYKEELVPAILAVDGCRAAFLVGMEEKNEGLSITIWDSQEQAVAYEESGRFAELLARAAPLLSSLYQWKMTLNPSTRDRTVTSDEVTVKGYTVISGMKVS